MACQGYVFKREFAGQSIYRYDEPMIIDFGETHLARYWNVTVAVERWV